MGALAGAFCDGRVDAFDIAPGHADRKSIDRKKCQSSSPLTQLNITISIIINTNSNIKTNVKCNINLHFHMPIDTNIRESEADDNCEASGCDDADDGMVP